MGTKDWRIIVYVSAADDDPNPEGTTADFTITSAHLLEAPRIGGQRIRPLSGSAESLSWSAIVGDFSEFFTGNMTDGQGRMNVAGRLVRAQENVDGGGFVTVWAGRLTGVTEAEGPGRYEIRFSDERWLGRDLKIYQTASTAQIVPAGVKAAWKNAPAAGTASVAVGAVTATDVLVTVLDDAPISRSVLELLRNDLKDDARPGASDGSTGNFENLRATIGGTVKEVVSFGLIDDPGPLDSLERQEDEEDRIKVITLWLAWGAGQPNVGDEFDDFVLTLDGAETSDAWPHHIGGVGGVDPIQEIKDRLDEHGLRFHASTFDTWDASTNPDGLIDHPLIPRLWFRITGSRNVLDWTDSVLRFLGLVPFVNTDGEIQPRFSSLLHDVDPTTLPEFTDADLADAASFDFRGTDAVTVVRPRAVATRRLRVVGITAHDRHAGLDDDWPADVLETEELDLPELTHDNVDDVGRRVHEIDSHGAEFRNAVQAKRFFRQQATEIFDRFGDGPIYGDIVGLAALDAVSPGEWFRLTATNYPVFTTGSRDGSTLVAQVLETRRDPEGPSLKFLTGGPDDQPLAAPSVAISTNVDRPKHDVDVTISSMPAGADRYQVQLREGTGPWDTVAEGTANETVTIRNLPSDTQIDAQVRATAGNAIRSAWSATSSVTTAALSPPTGATATATGRSVTLTWTNGESDYGLMLTVDGTDVLDEPLLPGTTEWVFVGLAESTAFTLGVKHVDPYGGESSLATDTATTGTANTLPAPGLLQAVQGFGSEVAEDTSGPPEGPAVTTWDPEESPTRPDSGVGVELRWRKAVPWAVTVVEHDTVDDFTNDPQRVSAGQASGVVIPLSGGTRRFFRIRHQALGFAPSAWHTAPDQEVVPGTSTTVPLYDPVSAVPAPIQDPSPDTIELLNPTVRYIPGVDGGVNGVFVEVSYTPTDRVADVYVAIASRTIPTIITTFDGRVSADRGETVTPGQENRHVVQDDNGDILFSQNLDDVLVMLCPLDKNNLAGLVNVVRPENPQRTGSGVRAEASAGGEILADKFVAGTNITIDPDGDGRPRVTNIGRT